jgi:signal transduction histidine kinase
VCGHQRLSCPDFAIDGVFDAVRAEASAADGVALQWHVERPMPPLRSDAEKLGTIVRNLVENACKYTPQGTIRIAARWDRGRDEIDIRVSDTGIGIAPADLDGVFAAFRQGGNRGDLARNGVGLGLFIVQRLTARLGGDVSVESRLGIGSTFILRIPRLLHRGAAVPVASPEDRQWASA